MTDACPDCGGYGRRYLLGQWAPCRSCDKPLDDPVDVALRAFVIDHYGQQYGDDFMQFSAWRPRIEAVVKALGLPTGDRNVEP